MKILLRLIVLCGLLLPVYALAQSEEDLAKAQQIFNEGELLYNVREFDQALKKYKEAYLLSAAPELLFNIGQCYRNIGQYQEAIGSYRSFLRARPESPNRAQVEQLITDLEAKLKESPTAEPKTKATAPTAPKQTLSPVPFYAGAAGSLALGAFFGVAFLSSRQVTLQLANTDDSSLLQDEINQQIKRTKLVGTAANACVALSFISGGLGLWATKKKNATDHAVTVSLAPQQISLSGSF
jgi:tetratricopeptide (TPR) repeat protein